jgi:uncharacterized protein with PIN domain
MAGKPTQYSRQGASDGLSEAAKPETSKSITITPDMIEGNYELKVDVSKSQPKLKPNEYRCENCLEIYEKDWSDEEAQAEYEQNFPNSGEEQAIVCDDCYKKMIAWKSPKQYANERLSQRLPQTGADDE